MGHLSDTSATDREVMRDLGRRLLALRESQRLTMLETAERAALSRQTLYRAERGRNPTLLTIVRLLRVYGRLGALESFIPEPEISPMAVLEERRAT